MKTPFAGAASRGPGLSAVHLTRALDASPRRLGRDAVDLYQVHAYGPLTPLEETALLDAASDPGPVDHPCGELGVRQRMRSLGAS